MMTPNLGRFSRPLLALTAAAFLTLGFSISANAMQIQQVKSKKGIEAWLVEDHTRPILSLQFAFAGGTAQDPAGKPGVATFVASMLDEGSGNLNSEAFQTRLEELAAKMSFTPNYDHFDGSFQTLTENRAESFKLLKSALTSPHFTPEDTDRIREQLIANIKQDDKDPDKMALRDWFQLVFNKHPYANPTSGTVASVSAITPDDLRAYVKKNFARGTLKVAAVGDIDAAGLSAILDDVFGDLPEKAELTPVSDFKWSMNATQKIVEMPNPQSVAIFGFDGLLRKDPDFIPAYILNYVIGGGGFASKLMQEVREKRGLCYSVYSYLYPLKHAGLFLGGVATENKAVSESMNVIKSELNRVATNGITEAELKAAKDFLIGSFALRFDTSSKIAAQLLAIQLDDLGIDYIQRRNSEIEAITVADVQRAAKRLVDTQNLVVTVVGNPEGMKNAGL